MAMPRIALGYIAATLTAVVILSALLIFDGDGIQLSNPQAVRDFNIFLAYAAALIGAVMLVPSIAFLALIWGKSLSDRELSDFSRM